MSTDSDHRVNMLSPSFSLKVRLNQNKQEQNWHFRDRWRLLSEKLEHPLRGKYLVPGCLDPDQYLQHHTDFLCSYTKLEAISELHLRYS